MNTFNPGNTMNVYDYIEDFDNGSLDFPEWFEQMIQAVKDYNEEFGTLHDPQRIVAQYCSMTRSTEYGDR